MPPKNSKSNETALREKKSPKIEKNVLAIKTRAKRPVVVHKNNKEDEPVPSTGASLESTRSSSTKKKTLRNTKKVKPVPSTSAFSESTSSSSAEKKTSRNTKKVKPVPSTSAFSESTSSSSAEKKKSKYDSYKITPKIIKSRLNAYKLSPDYENLKKKRFNTSFRFERPRGDRQIEIFTPEEEEKFRRENPDIHRDYDFSPRIDALFMSIPEINIDDVEEEIAAMKAKKAKSEDKPKRGRKKSFGYKGVPFPDTGLSITDVNTQLMLTP